MIRLGLVLGFLGLLGVFAQILILLCVVLGFFLGLGRWLLGAWHKHPVQVELFKGVGVFLVVLFDFLRRNFRGFVGDSFLQFFGQNLHPGKVDGQFKLLSLLEALFLGRG